MTPFKRLLLAEDSADDIELILGALPDGIGARVDVVRDGAEALEYLRCEGRFRSRDSSAPAAVILDLKLPKISGLQVLQEMRASLHFAHIPVVVLTSSREQRDVVDSYKLGANAYVVKPLKYAEFTDAVQRLGVFWAEINEPPAGPGR
jgi:CheY-like chemotaxis protein